MDTLGPHFLLAMKKFCFLRGKDVLSGPVGSVAPTKLKHVPFSSEV